MFSSVNNFLIYGQIELHVCYFIGVCVNSQRCSFHNQYSFVKYPKYKKASAQLFKKK